MRKNCGKVVIENFFEPCVLYLLLRKPSYGYELIKNLKDGCQCNVNAGNLYRGLARLEKEKNIIKRKLKSAFGPDKYIYELTPKGKKLLSGWMDELKHQNLLIDRLIKNYRKQI